MNDNLHYDARGIVLTETSEGCSLTSYWDKYGKCWTIGVGHTGPDVTAGLVITQDQADKLLLSDITSSEICVKSQVTVPLTQGQYDALVDFCFNEGCKNFASSTLLALVNLRKFDDAEKQFNRWVYAGGQVLAGLTKRRDAESKLFES